MNDAVGYALGQIGKAYQFRGEGPDSFDCSGLTMRALAKVGVRVPHQSGQQASTLGAVEPTAQNKKQLRPGDLVFYYGTFRRPESISHVGIYVGRRGPFWDVVAAVDEQHGVIRHRMNWALRPSAFGFVGHDQEA